MADLKALEHPTLKVPYEVLNKKFRAGQKTVDREVSHIQTSIAELEKSLFKTPVEVDQICNLIGATVEKLQTMKRKVSCKLLFCLCFCFDLVCFYYCFYVYFYFILMIILLFDI